MSTHDNTISARRQPIIIEVGQRFGRLVVLEGLIREPWPTKHRPNRTMAKHRCRCDCGNEIFVGAYWLRIRNTQSCGCLRSEKASQRAAVRNYRHGLTIAGSRPPEYGVWQGIRKRCHNPNHQDYSCYGGRGIIVSDRWRESFAVFFEDMGPRPSKNHQIERIDNDGPYSAENCRWATVNEQSRNRRNTVMLEHQRRRMTLTEWSKETGIGRSTIGFRLARGWPVADALTVPANQKRKT